VIVIDAGAFLEILLAGPAGARVATFVEQDQVAAPQLFDAEVFHRLLRLEKTGGLHSDAVTTGLADLADAPITRYPHGRCSTRPAGSHPRCRAMTPSTPRLPPSSMACS